LVYTQWRVCCWTNECSCVVNFYNWTACWAKSFTGKLIRRLQCRFCDVGCLATDCVALSRIWCKNSILRLKRDGTRAETRFGLSAKWSSPFKSAGASVQSTKSSRGVRINVSNAGFTKFRGSLEHRLSTGYPLHQFPLHFPSRASPCAITFQLDSTTVRNVIM
jgi:hypothetical protein